MDDDWVEGEGLAFPSPAVTRSYRRASLFRRGSQVAQKMEFQVPIGEPIGNATPTAALKGASESLLERTPGQLLRGPRDPLPYDPFAERPERRKSRGRSRGRRLLRNGNAADDDGSGEDEGLPASGDDLLPREIRTRIRGAIGGGADLDTVPRTALEDEFARVLLATSDGSVAGSSAASQPAARKSGAGPMGIAIEEAARKRTGGPHDPLTALSLYEEACHNASVSRSPDHEPSALRAEAATWRLVAAVYPERIREEAREMMGMTPALGSFYGDLRASCAVGNLSPHAVALRVLTSDPFARELRLAAEWLEGTFEEGSGVEGVPGGWERTLGRARRSGREPPSLDPDHAHRGGRESLHPSDADADAVLSRSVWTLMRSGRFANARELCRRCGQHWRAAALGGGLLFHDPAAAGEDGLPFGSPHLSAFRRSSEALCAVDTLDPHERAVHAVLCGRWKEAIPVCGTWEDEAWVRITAALDQRIAWAVEYCLSGNGRQEAHDDTSMDEEDAGGAPPGLHDLPTLSSVLPDLPHGSDPTDDISDPSVQLRAAQVMILRGDEPRLAESIADWCRAADESLQASHPGLSVWGGNGNGNMAGNMNGHRGRSLMSAAFTAPPPPPGLMPRFGTHLLFFLASLGMDVDTNAVAKMYTQSLSRRRRAGLVAAYAARLSPEDSLGAFSAFLATVTDPAERERCLEMGRAAGVEVRGVAAEVVRRIWEDETVPSSTSGPSGPSRALAARDESLLRSLDWLRHDPHQLPLLAQRSCSLMRRFLHEGRESASLRIVSIAGEACGVDGPCGSQLRDMCGYAQCVEAFRVWSRERSVRGGDPDKAADEVVSIAGGLLLRPDGGFLSSEEEGDDAGDASPPLRPVLLPRLVTNLITVLQYLGDHAGVLGVARVLADNYQCTPDEDGTRVAIPHLMSREELRGILRLVAASATRLAQAAIDTSAQK